MGADAVGVRTTFGAGGFLAGGGGAAGAADGDAAAAAGAERGGAAGAVPGSGFMMLIGGVDAAVGNSALVGLPVGAVGPGGVAADVPKMATAGPAGAAGAGVGVFHDAA